MVGLHHRDNENGGWGKKMPKTGYVGRRSGQPYKLIYIYIYIYIVIY
jgi:hypothetical protein